MPTASAMLRDVVERTQIARKDGAVKYAEGDTWIELPADAAVSMNMWGFRPALFDELAPRFERFLRADGTQLKSEFYITMVVGELVREGRARVKVLRSGDSWYGVTYKDDLASVRDAVAGLVREGKYPKALWS